MKYYKDKNLNYCSTDNVLPSDCEEITEDEYNVATTRLQAENDAQELSKDEYIKQLEAENASFLYQILTGEEFTDV